MVYSNTRKLTLSAWLKINRVSEYNTPLKLQKFLFLYEAFSKVAGDEKADFGHLRGYKNGPVFSNVFGDYTKERWDFEQAASACFKKFGSMINVERAMQCAFIVSILSEQELSSLTHAMNIWKKQEKFILNGGWQVPLYEADFSEEDSQMITNLGKMYPIEMIRTSEIVRVGNFYFVMDKADYPKLTEEHLDILATLAEKTELHNPVFLEIDSEGGLILD